MSDQNNEEYMIFDNTNPQEDENEEEAREEHTYSGKVIFGFLKKAQIGEYEFTLNGAELKNPGDLLEKLSVLKENETLTNQEKNAWVQKILNEYME